MLEINVTFLVSVGLRTRIPSVTGAGGASEEFPARLSVALTSPGSVGAGPRIRNGTLRVESGGTGGTAVRVSCRPGPEQVIQRLATGFSVALTTMIAPSASARSPTTRSGSVMSRGLNRTGDEGTDSFADIDPRPPWKSSVLRPRLSATGSTV